MTLPTLDDARDAARRAEAAATVAAHHEWASKALAAVRHVASTRSEFISDDVWDAMARWYPNLDTHEHRAMAGVLRRAVANGWCRLASCERCGTVKVIRPGRAHSAHASDQPVYRSQLVAGER